ncbi:NERD domain-containing protein [Streptomyces atratus]|uniref:NERD domain-containing protein n=1 Tax=Streptomyces atratus TaxID=1893 RepID=UPI0034059D16
MIKRWLGKSGDLRSWEVGLRGELIVGSSLNRLRRDGWRVLHSIELPSGSDIDHVVIGPPGVFTVNAKHHKGGRGSGWATTPRWPTANQQSTYGTGGFPTALRLRREAQEIAKRAAGELWTDSDFVFTTRYGTPIEPRNFNRAFAAGSAAATVRKIRLHDTRHTCGSLLAALDVRPRTAIQILRHSKIAVTMEVYTHIPSEATRRALKKLGAQDQT